MGGHPPPGKSVGRYPLFIFYNLRPGNRRLFPKTCHFSRKRVTFPETDHFFQKSITFSENRPQKTKMGLKMWPISWIHEKRLKKKKKRPLAVTNIFMPDFRHAHTLQQSLERTRIDLSVRCSFYKFFMLLSVVSRCVILFWCLFLFVIETRGGTRNESTDCCSVWAWRKSGIKMLVTARGLFFSFFNLFSWIHEIGHILRPIFVFPPRFHEKVTDFYKKWRIPGKVDDFPEKWADFPKSGSVLRKSGKSGSISLNSPNFSWNCHFS